MLSYTNKKRLVITRCFFLLCNYSNLLTFRSITFRSNGLCPSRELHQQIHVGKRTRSLFHGSTIHKNIFNSCMVLNVESGTLWKDWTFSPPRRTKRESTFAQVFKRVIKTWTPSVVSGVFLWNILQFCTHLCKAIHKVSFPIPVVYKFVTFFTKTN